MILYNSRESKTLRWSVDLTTKVISLFSKVPFLSKNKNKLHAIVSYILNTYYITFLKVISIIYAIIHIIRKLIWKKGYKLGNNFPNKYTEEKVNWKMIS